MLKGFLKQILFSFITIIIFASCDFFSSKSYDAIEGEHCVVLITSDNYDDETYGNICLEGDTAYEDVVRLTGLSFTKKVLITYDPVRNERIYIYALAYVDGDTVFLCDYFFDLSLTEMQDTLRHEITHVVMAFYFGITNSFLFTEGIAVYIENRKSIPEFSGLRDEIEDVLRFTHWEFYLQDDYDDIISDYYKLGGELTAYWCETFGMENFYALYKEVSTINYREIMEKYGKKPFEEIIEEFKVFY
jgi:hypothetical protein